MLRVLLKQQFLAFFSSFRIGKRKNGVATRRSLGSTLLIAGLLAFCVIYFAAMFYLMFLALFRVLAGTEYIWVGFAVMGILVFMIDFVMTIFTARSQLFEAKDNDLLLSLPIRPRDILLSRMLMILITDYLFELIILIPVYIAFVVAGGFSFMGLVCVILTGLVMPLLALSFSCLVGWILSLVAAHMKNAAILNTILSLLLFGGYMALCMGIQDFSAALLANITAIAPVIKKYLYPFYCLGDACVNGNFLSAVIYIVTMLVPFIITCVILAKTFLSMVTKKQGVVRRAYREEATKVKPLMLTLIGRELRRLFSSVTYLINSAVGLIMMLFLGVGSFFMKDLFLVLGDGWGITPDVLAPAAMIAALSLLGGMCFFTASSISLEGQAIYDVKALPLPGNKFLFAKIAMHLTMVLPFSLVCSILCIIALPCNFFMAVLLIFIPMLMNVFYATTGLAMNMAFPRFDWDSEAVVVKQSLSMTLTMLINFFGTMILIGLTGGLAFLFPVIPVGVCILLVFLIPAGVTLALLLYILRRGDRVLARMG